MRRKTEVVMIGLISKRSAVALCAAALVGLAPLAAAGSASAQTRPHSTVHAVAGASTHQAMMRPMTGQRMHVGVTFRDRNHFVSTRRSFGGRFVVAHRDFDHRRFGWRGRFWSRPVFGAAVYPVYAYGYGYRHHSCWWYRHFDPADMPAWCGAYGYSYGYGPAYAYGYGPYGFGYSYGIFGRRFDRDRFERRHFAFDRTRHFDNTRNFAFGNRTHSMSQFAFHGAATRPMEGRAALVGGGQGGVRFQSGPHNFGGAGAAHFGGGGAHMGGSAHVGGHLNQH